MPDPQSPHIIGNFGNVLDPRFQKIFFEQFEQQDSMLGAAFTFVDNNGRETQTYSEVGALGDWPQFDGQIRFDAVTAGFDTTLTPVEWAQGFDVQRRLFNTTQHGIFDARPAAMATAAARTREGHGARVFNGGFGTDPTFATRTDGLPLFSNAHITNSGASTAVGFDNKGSSSFSATALESTRQLMSDFRDDRANRIDVKPNEIWAGIDNQEKIWEVIESQGKVDTDNNNANFNQNAYTSLTWRYLNADNWFVADARMRKMMNKWTDAIPVEFAFVEDFNSLRAKWRGYMVYAHHFVDWRWGFGHEV